MNLYLVIEHFRDGDPRPVYARFAREGRLAPDGLHDLGSRVTEDLQHCCQVMACEDRALLDLWIAPAADPVDFEVHPVLTCAKAADRVAALR